MSNVEVFENLCDEEFNHCCKMELIHNNRWFLSADNTPEGYSDSGFLSCTYHEDPANSSVYPQNTLTAWAFLVYNKVMMRSKRFKNPRVNRFLWNYYNTGSEGSLHQDIRDVNVNAHSIVYYLDDSDGGTYVEDEFFPSKQGSAILFPSQLKHRGVGPKNSSNRFVLNVMFIDD